MAITYSHARGYLGKTVVAQCRDGRHVGVVRNVTRDGIWLQRTGGQVSAEPGMLNVETADRASQVDAQEVFWPLLFLPFFTLLALAPWYRYGYGYPGYYW
ncbi:hypothetical protein EV586_103169 [Tumebacillus sp. BK434]|uniref:hypothetical protein n=1 Tax=Tumebacillus sp. BK434 TaxID=2512169 RepID=UPI0010453AEF|nr:hypothetical protein [Tumebacillus sp. BK434]TCP55516.1 hypothetical protein EV586_103169 [Tumebacillus sp. BK434]